MIVPNATKLFTLKWLILCAVNFNSTNSFFLSDGTETKNRGAGIQAWACLHGGQRAGSQEGDPGPAPPHQIPMGQVAPSCPAPHWPRAYLKKPDEERHSAHGIHEVAVVAQQGDPAAAHPQVELLRLVVVAVVCRVVGELVLDTGPWRAGVAAAEGDSIHQVPPIHVALDTTGGETDGLRPAS